MVSGCSLAEPSREGRCGMRCSYRLKWLACPCIGPIWAFWNLENVSILRLRADPGLALFLHEPVDHLYILFRAARVAQFVIMIILLGEVEEDTGTLEDADFLLLAIRCLENVRDGWLRVCQGIFVEDGH